MATTREEIYRLCEAMEQAYAEAIAEHSGVGATLGRWVSGVESNPARMLERLKGKSLDPWKERGYALAAGSYKAEGQAALDRWVDSGNGIVASLRDQAGIAKEHTFQRIISDTVTATASDLKDVGKAGAKVVGWLGGNIGLVATIVVALVVLTVVRRVL